MTIRKRLIIAAIAGLFISGIGFGLVAIGGWRCGPANTVAEIGGYLSFYHLYILYVIFPSIDTWMTTNPLISNTALILVVPAIVWFILIFILITLWQAISKKRSTA